MSENASTQVIKNRYKNKMSENASSQAINNRYEHKEIVINAHWNYDQRASMAYEILKELLKSKNLPYKLYETDLIVDLAFDIESAFHNAAESHDMIIGNPAELPLKG
jgi:hypothetical protein